MTDGFGDESKIEHRLNDRFDTGLFRIQITYQICPIFLERANWNMDSKEINCNVNDDHRLIQKLLKTMCDYELKYFFCIILLHTNRI